MSGSATPAVNELSPSMSGHPAIDKIDSVDPVSTGNGVTATAAGKMERVALQTQRQRERGRSRCDTALIATIGVRDFPVEAFHACLTDYRSVNCRSEWGLETRRSCGRMSNSARYSRIARHSRNRKARQQT